METLLTLAQAGVGTLLALGNVIDAQEDLLNALELTGADHQNSVPDDGKILLDLEAPDCLVIRQNALQHDAKARNVPAAVGERVEKLAFGLTPWDLERAVESRVRGLDPQIRIEYQQGCGDGVNHRQGEVARRGKRRIVRQQLLIQFGQFFVGGLELCFGILQFLVQALQFLVGGERLLGAVLAFLLGYLVLFDDAPGTSPSHLPAPVSVGRSDDS